MVRKKTESEKFEGIDLNDGASKLEQMGQQLHQPTQAPVAKQAEAPKTRKNPGKKPKWNPFEDIHARVPQALADLLRQKATERTMQLLQQGQTELVKLPDIVTEALLDYYKNELPPIDQMRGE